VEELVQQVIQDPTIKIATIPDVLEIQIYRSTINLVIDALYRVLNQLHGTKIANTSHEIQLKRIDLGLKSSRKKLRQHYNERKARTITDVSDDFLEGIAEGMLSNRNINQRFLPDSIEKKLYINCLKLIFRLLEMIADCIKITVCGHDLRIAISKASVETAMENATMHMAEVDRSKLYEMAKTVGDLDHKTGKMFWLSRKKQAFLHTLHASMLALLLAILDDLMHKTCIELFSDRMVLDIVPSTTNLKNVSVGEHDLARPHKAVHQKTHPLLTFLAGVGVGVGLAFVRKG
jgi:hypothetical protein